jgi:beta-mannosidase
MDLSGRWHALVADDDLRRTWLDDVDEDGWEPIEVPGHWRTTPAFADSDGPLLHRRRFVHDVPADDERWWLVLDGCFYQGDVWLDGAYVGDTEGSFFPHAFEVTEALAVRTEHVLGVELACARPGNLAAKRNLTGAFQHADAIDPALNPGGIWRPVRLERSGPVRIRHLRVLCREATAEQAVVSVRAVLDAADAGTVEVRTTVAGIEVVERHTLAAGENQLTWIAVVPDPDLWWPHALGAQPLHGVDVEVGVPVSDDDGAPVVASDRRTRRVGFRQVALRGWTASVNGERLFLKGATYLPTRALLAAASPDDVRADVARAVDAGLDLLRVHSHIGRPELYEAADEAGLLLWQDLPLHGGYARTVRKQAMRQAREAVDLLGHHPSVAIWCGHDEPFPVEVDPELGPVPVSVGKTALRQQIPSWNASVLDRSIKRMLQRQDGTRPVVAHSGVAPHPPKLDGTDTHLAFGWGGGDERGLPAFARLLPRFVRFAVVTAPAAVPESDDFVASGSWPDLDWDRLVRGHRLARRLFERHVPPSSYGSYEAWRAATQEHQARVVRRQVEELRRLKYQPTGGVVVHTLSDAQAAVSSALLDHERRPKPAWDALRAACRPVIVVADQLPAVVAPGDALALDVHVVSDLRTPLDEVVATVEARWPGGSHAWRATGPVPADACTRVTTIQLVVPDTPGDLTLTLSLSSGPDEIATNHDTTLIQRP